MLINIKYFFHNRKIQQVPYKKYYIVYIKQVISNILNTLKIVWYIIHNTIYFHLLHNINPIDSLYSY